MGGRHWRPPLRGLTRSTVENWQFGNEAQSSGGWHQIHSPPAFGASWFEPRACTIHFVNPAHKTVALRSRAGLWPASQDVGITRVHRVSGSLVRVPRWLFGN